jgi:hypothetical protein
MQACKEPSFAARLVQQITDVDDIAKLNLAELKEQLSPAAEASLYAIGMQIQAKYKVTSVVDLCQKLDIPIMSENRGRKEILVKTLLPFDYNDLKSTDQKTLHENEKLKHLAQTVFDVMATKTGIKSTTSDNLQRIAPWFQKELLAIYRREEITYANISDVTGIPTKTIERYSRSEQAVFSTKIPSDQYTKQLEEYWYNAPNAARKNIGIFIEYMDRNHKGHGLSHDFIRNRSMQIGLRESRTRKTEERNTGAHDLATFQPLSCWSCDGKHIKVAVNGKNYDFLWYAFACSTTTIFVGASVAKVENSQAFLEALKDGEKQSGSFPIAIVMDNRLSKGGEFDLSDETREGNSLPDDILSFLKEHNIVLIKTHNRNPKSNIMENCFSVFAQSDISFSMDFRGKSDEEIAREYTRAILSVYMKARDAAPRKRLGNRSPIDLCREAKPDDKDRPALEKLRDRHEKKKKMNDEKLAGIYASIPSDVSSHFRFPLSGGNPSRRFLRFIGGYSPAEIVAASAAFAARCVTNPTESYDESYFLGILRRKREQRAKAIHANIYTQGVSLSKEYFKNIATTGGIKDLAKKLVEDLGEIACGKNIHHRTYYLIEFVFFLVLLSNQFRLSELWRELLTCMARSNDISPAWQATVIEFVSERLGALLYPDSVRATQTYNESQGPPNKDDEDLTSKN